LTTSTIVVPSVAEPLAQPFGDVAREDVGAAAGRVGHDQADRLVRPGLVRARLLRGCGGGQAEGGGGGERGGGDARQPSERVAARWGHGGSSWVRAIARRRFVRTG
jgi:hypothetical protein